MSPAPESLECIEGYLACELVSDIKHEYVAGAVHAMSGGTNRPACIATNVLGTLDEALKGHSCQPFNSDPKVRLEITGQTRIFYPDAQVV